MEYNDLINGSFEFVGSITIWISVFKLYKDKTIKGVYWPAWLFFAAWGGWNLWYYPSVGHMFSFWMGLLLFSGNCTWSILAIYYRFFIKEA